MEDHFLLIYILKIKVGEIYARSKSVSCGYDSEDIVKNVSFKVERGNNLCIVGPNGCGKSTLLKSIANLLDYREI